MCILFFNSTFTKYLITTITKTILPFDLAGQLVLLIHPDPEKQNKLSVNYKNQEIY